MDPKPPNIVVLVMALLRALRVESAEIRYPSPDSTSMEFRQLRYFIAVGEEEHFGRASKRLGVVQPALTRQIRQLQDELGATLLERVGRGVRLTTTGRIFLEDARRTLGEAERTKQRAQLAARGQVGTLKVSFAEAAAYNDTFATILTKFRERFSDVQLDLVSLRSLEQWKALQERRVNVGFVYYLPAQFPELQSQLLTSEPVVLVTPKDHRLAHKSKVFLRDLRDEPFLWVRRDVPSPYYDSMAEACRTGGLTMKIVQTVPTEPMMLSFVTRSVGVCFAVASRVLKHKLPNLVPRKVDDLKLSVNLSAMWRVDDDAPTLPKFVSLIRDVQRQRKGKGG